MSGRKFHDGRHALVWNTGSSSSLLTSVAYAPTRCSASLEHDILLKARAITHLYGHSKGALCIENAARSLRDKRARSIDITTFGCAIDEETRAHYEQILGRIDGLDQLNSWANLLQRWIERWHSPNTLLPLTIPLQSHETTQAREHSGVVTPDIDRRSRGLTRRVALSTARSSAAPSPQASARRYRHIHVTGSCSPGRACNTGRSIFGTSGHSCRRTTSRCNP